MEGLVRPLCSSDAPAKHHMDLKQVESSGESASPVVSAIIKHRLRTEIKLVSGKIYFVP